MIPMPPMTHPVDLGDLPNEVQLRACAGFFGLEYSTLLAHWKTRYACFIRRDAQSNDLWVNVKAADAWLDARGRSLLSGLLLADKKRRNPGWTPFSESIRQAMAQQLVTSFAVRGAADL